MFTDPVGDMLARMRNAIMRKKDVVSVPNSRFKRGVLDALIREGFVLGYGEEERNLVVRLKYFRGQSVIKSMSRVSKPSIHIHRGIRNMTPVANGLGISVLSTSSGVLSDKEARQKNVGGKILITVR